MASYFTYGSYDYTPLEWNIMYISILLVIISFLLVSLLDIGFTQLLVFGTILVLFYSMIVCPPAKNIGIRRSRDI